MPTPVPPSSSSSSSGNSEPPSDASVVKSVDWQDYRDHLATAHKDGSRRWIFAKKPAGPYFRARTYVSGLLLWIMFAGPFIRIQGQPLLMMNIIERRFVILGQVFWPQDIAIFAVAMLIFLTGIIIFTAAFGRIWCGWTCPQTVLMEMVFRKIEYWIEGDAAAQRALDAAPWTRRKILLKAAKHAIFLGLSFAIGNTLLSYIIGSDQLIQIITDDPRRHWQGLFFMTLFTLLFYAIFARFREQACTFICPYGRFQSALLDENTIVVAYDHRRGERRGHLARGQDWPARQSSGAGDCVDCRQCVAVCPTGIDIRDGTQMECVNCTACMDACDTIMDKVARPKGLIRYASLNGIERREPLRVTPRLLGYAGVLTALIGLFFYLLFTRSDVQATLLRARGALYQVMPDGRVSNLYTLKLINKTAREMEVDLRLQGTPGRLRILGRQPRVPAGQLIEASVLIELEREQLRGSSTPLRIGVFAGDRELDTLKTSFVGPRN